MLRLTRPCALAALLLAFVPGPASRAQAVAGRPAQLGPGSPAPHPGWTEAEEQARVRAIVGDLGLPSDAELESAARPGTMFREDRRLVGQSPASAGDAAAPVKFTVPASQTGTGISELVWYQLPSDYKPNGPARPLLVAWHGYGSSAFSVGTQSTLDEECDARGWIYLSVTGLDDKLFGSLSSQANVTAAIKWALSTFKVDPDRIYMVGFSMGAGCVASFASRHRDPDGLMIAALGLVSGTYDWTQTYTIGTAAVKGLMENPFNFGGSPAAFPWAYQQVSSLYFDPASYPPSPGTALPKPSMGDNLDTLPIWATWDTGDPIPESPPLMGAALVNLVQSVGGQVETHVVSGTVDPVTLLPAPHSWAVLDEAALCNFLADQVVQRLPAEVHAQLDADEAVSYLQVTQRTAGAFSFLHGDVTGPDAARVLDVENAEEVVFDAGAAGVGANFPLHLRAGSADADGFRLRLTGFVTPPSYLLSPTSGQLIEGVESDPLTGSLLLDVPGFATIDALVISEPWTGTVRTAPDPVTPGGLITLFVDMPAGANQFGLLVISTDELLTPVKGGYKITVSALPPALIANFPLDAQGDLLVAASLPADPALSGLVLPTQVIAASGKSVTSISNLWHIHID